MVVGPFLRPKWKARVLRVHLRLFVVLLFLSAFFVGLTLFTGRQSARTPILELQHASDLLASKADRASAPDG
jgi:hypothetical protein